MNKIVTIIYVCGITVSGAFAETLSVGNLANRITSTPLVELTRADIPNGFEVEVLEVLRTEQKYAVLLRLNDQVTIDEVVEEYKVTKGMDRRLRQALKWCASPHIIDEFAPLLYVEDKVQLRRWPNDSHGEYDYGYSLSVAEVIAAVVNLSPEFSNDVQKSAKIIGPGIGQIQIMRAWWEQNENALKEGRYSDVTQISADLVSEDERQQSDSRTLDIMAAKTNSFHAPKMVQEHVSESNESVNPQPDTDSLTMMDPDHSPRTTEDSPFPIWWLWLSGMIVLVAALIYKVCKRTNDHKAR